MSDTDLSPSWYRLASRLLGADDAEPTPVTATGLDLYPGRHSNHAEIAAETPIFHDLTVRRRSPRPEPAVQIPAPRTDPLTEFRRDPLTAPFPVQVNTEARVPAARTPVAAPAISLLTASGTHARPELYHRGRHHRSG